MVTAAERTKEVFPSKSASLLRGTSYPSLDIWCPLRVELGFSVCQSTTLRRMG
jgi:hypothetical protein